MSSRKFAPIAFEYLVPSLKTWPISIPWFTTIAAPQRGQGSPAAGVAEVEHAVEREVAAGDDAREVDVDLVAADDHRRHRGDRAVDDQRDLDPDRPEEAHRGPGGLLDRRGVGRDERRRAEGPADLRLVGLVVAPDQGGDGLAVGQEDQELGRSATSGTLRKSQTSWIVRRFGRRDRLKAGPRGSGGCRARARADLGPLDVGRVAAARGTG